MTIPLVLPLHTQPAAAEPGEVRLQLQVPGDQDPPPARLQRTRARLLRAELLLPDALAGDVDTPTLRWLSARVYEDFLLLHGRAARGALTLRLALPTPGQPARWQPLRLHLYGLALPPRAALTALRRALATLGAPPENEGGDALLSLCLRHALVPAGYRLPEAPALLLCDQRRLRGRLQLLYKYKEGGATTPPPAAEPAPAHTHLAPEQPAALLGLFERPHDPIEERCAAAVLAADLLLARGCQAAWTLLLRTFAVPPSFLGGRAREPMAPVLMRPSPGPPLLASAEAAARGHHREATLFCMEGGGDPEGLLRALLRKPTELLLALLAQAEVRPHEAASLLLRAATCALEQGHPDRAASLCERALRLPPDSADVVLRQTPLLFLGDYYFERDVPDKALRCYRQALALAASSAASQEGAAMPPEEIARVRLRLAALERRRGNRLLEEHDLMAAIEARGGSAAWPLLATLYRDGWEPSRLGICLLAWADYEQDAARTLLLQQAAALVNPSLLPFVEAQLHGAAHDGADPEPASPTDLAEPAVEPPEPVDPFENTEKTLVTPHGP